MPFDPTKPVAGTPVDADEMRGQLNALKALNDDLRQQVATSALVLTANNATMSLDWIYTGPPCDGFHIFVHQPNDAPGIFNDRAQVAGGLRTWATGFDSPADAAGYQYYLVPMDGDENPLTPQSNTVGFGVPSPGDLQSQLAAQQATINDMSLQAGDQAAAIQALQAAVAALQGN